MATAPAGKSPASLSALSQSQSVESPVSPASDATVTPQIACGTTGSCVIVDAGAPKKRSRHNTFFEPGKTYHCIILQNFTEEAKNQVLDTLDLAVAEAQGDMDSDDELPDENMDVIEVEIGRVRILLSEEDRKKHKTEYRENYVKRPEVIDKRKAKENDPVQKAKREEYSKDPAVKERKADCTKARQAVTRKLKKTNPELYKKLREEAESEVKEIKKRKSPSSPSDEPAAKKAKTDSSESVMEVEQSQTY